MLYKEIKNNIRKDYQDKLYICKELFWDIMNNENTSKEEKNYLNNLLDDNAKLYLYKKEFDDEVINDYQIKKDKEEKKYQEALKKNKNAKRMGAFDTRNPYEFYANILIGNITEYISLFYFYQKGDSIIKNPFASHGKTVNSNFDFIYIRGSQNYNIEMQTYYSKKENIEIKQTKLDAGKKLEQERKKAYFLNLYIPESAKYEDIEISFMNVNNIVKNKKYKENLYGKQFGGKAYVELTDKLVWKKSVNSLKEELK
jgi:hypothetical protein